MLEASTLRPMTEGSCPLCEVALRERLAGIAAGETGERFAVDACPRCGLGRTRPRPVDLGPYYDAAYYGRRHGVTARLCNRRRMNLVRRRAGPASGRSLLDFGCGDGEFGRMALREGWKCWGVERARDPAARAGFPIVADLDALDGAPRFSVATFWHVLEHLDDPAGTLALARDRLEPDGLVLASVPNFASWQSRLTGASWLHLDLPRHLWHFTPDSLVRMVESAGFRVEEIIHGEIEYDVVGWSQSLINAWLGGRNEFFRAMSGRPGSRGVRGLFHVPLGLALSAAMAGPAWVEGRAGRGGTLVVAARLSSG